jgi:heme/copper-type cytochrome/quinol oxidase subunit 2
VLLLLGWIRRNRAALPFGGTERAATRLVVGLGIATPLVLLTALFVWSDVFVIRTTAAPSPKSTGLTVRVIAHQWFWTIEYNGGRIITANELPVALKSAPPSRRLRPAAGARRARRVPPRRYGRSPGTS